MKAKVMSLCASAAALTLPALASAEEDFDVTEAVSSIESASANIGAIGTAIVVVGALVFGIGVVRGMTKT